MNVGAMNFANTYNVATPWKTTGISSDTSTVAAPQDGVVLSGASAEAAAEPEKKTSIGRGLMVGLALAFAMAGATGCASTQHLPNLQTTVDGGQAKTAFESLSFLDNFAGKDGTGGLFKGKDRVEPLRALDMMLDGETVVFKTADGKQHPIRSWAELQGVNELIKQMAQPGGIPR